MKKKLLCILLIICMIWLTACTDPSPRKDRDTAPTFISLPPFSETDPTDTEPTETEPTETEIPAETEPAPPEHSELYIPGLSVEDVILYFNEVCLDAEFSLAGDSSVVQKWGGSILYTLHGEYTDEDITTLTAFTNWLNTIEGFPGIYEADDPVQATLNIYFCTEEELLEILGDNFWGTDGGVTFWYENDEIYNAVICYRTDLDQYLRNSVILEEIYNGLGPVQDTALREDSIIYTGFSEPQNLTEIDELILRLLYHPEIQCGMNAEECEAIIRELYY